MHGVIKTFRLINSHPLTATNRLAAFRRWLSWQIASRLARNPIAVDFVDSSRLLVASGMTSATGNIYTGLFEFEDMAFVLHYLREGDLFVDVGANVGVYTVLASAVVGAETVAIEPGRDALRALADNIWLNGIDHKVAVHPVVAGRSSGKVRVPVDGEPPITFSRTRRTIRRRNALSL
jgi:hypothetical protein